MLKEKYFLSIYVWTETLQDAMRECSIVWISSMLLVMIKSGESNKICSSVPVSSRASLMPWLPPTCNILFWVGTRRRKRSTAGRRKKSSVNRRLIFFGMNFRIIPPTSGKSNCRPGATGRARSFISAKMERGYISWLQSPWSRIPTALLLVWWQPIEILQHRRSWNSAKMNLLGPPVTSYERLWPLWKAMPSCCNARLKNKACRIMPKRLPKWMGSSPGSPNCLQTCSISRKCRRAKSPIAKRSLISMPGYMTSSTTFSGQVHSMWSRSHETQSVRSLGIKTAFPRFLLTCWPTRSNTHQRPNAWM